MQSIDPRAVLEQFVNAAGSQRKAARSLKISRVYVTKLLSGNRKFSKRVLKLLGLARVVIKAPQ